VESEDVSITEKVLADLAIELRPLSDNMEGEVCVNFLWNLPRVRTWQLAGAESIPQHFTVRDKILHGADFKASSPAVTSIPEPFSTHHFPKKTD
jgi:hypothetical protein